MMASLRYHLILYLLQSVSESVIVSNFEDSYCIYRACELVFNQLSANIHELRQPDECIFVCVQYI